jgi:hypothetical protein
VELQRCVQDFQKINTSSTKILGDIGLKLISKILKGKDFDELARKHKFMK